MHIWHTVDPFLNFSFKYIVKLLIQNQSEEKGNGTVASGCFRKSKRAAGEKYVTMYYVSKFIILGTPQAENFDILYLCFQDFLV